MAEETKHAKLLKDNGWQTGSLSGKSVSPLRDTSCSPWLSHPTPSPEWAMGQSPPCLFSKYWPKQPCQSNNLLT